MKKLLEEYFGKTQTDEISYSSSVGINVYFLDCQKIEVLEFYREQELRPFLKALDSLKKVNEKRGLEIEIDLSQESKDDGKTFIDIKTNSVPLAHELVRNFSFLNKFLELYRP